MNKPSLRRAAAWVSQSTEWLVLLMLLAASVPPVLFQHRSLIVVPNLNLLDGSWALDICYKAATGVWLGRDVIFTYGPLYEWLSSVPSRWIGVSTGTILATAKTLPTLVGVLAAFVSTRLLLPKVNPWKRALFLAVVLWSAPDIRISICLLAFLVFLRLADGVASSAGGVALPALGTSIICLASLLLSADAGLYSMAGLLLCLAITAIVKWRSAGVLTGLSMFLVAVSIYLAIFMMATNAVMSSPVNFSYWKSSLVLATNYRWFESKAITEMSTLRIVGVLVLGILVFGVAWWGRDSDGDHWTRRPAFLLSAFGLACLMMQTALVRSDILHVAIGIYPMFFLSGAVVIGGLTSVRWLSATLLALFIAATPLTLTAYSESFPSRLLKGAQELLGPNLACPEGKQEFDHACFSSSDAQLFTAVSAYVDHHTSPSDPILVFPYQNAFGVMSRRRVAGGVMQSYLANGDYLTELDLAGLRKARPPFGVYLPDAGISSYALDSVPNFTRSPGVWLYLLRHYRAQGSPAPGVLGLALDDSRGQRLIFTEERIADPVQTVRVTQPRMSVDLGAIQWPADGADFLRLRVRVNYALWWRVRKPSALALLMAFADGSREVIGFVVEPNRDSEIWVYPWAASAMAGYFSNDESQWPTGTPLTKLTLLLAPFDWISVSPESIFIESVKAVRVSSR